MADNNRSDENLKKAADEAAEKGKEKIDQARKAAEESGADMRDQVREAASRVQSRAEDMWDDASSHASSLSQRARDQAYMVTETARENPAATATVLTSFGLLCFGIGLVIGKSMQDR